VLTIAAAGARLANFKKLKKFEKTLDKPVKVCYNGRACGRPVDNLWITRCVSDRLCTHRFFTHWRGGVTFPLVGFPLWRRRTLLKNPK